MSDNEKGDGSGTPPPDPEAERTRILRPVTEQGAEEQPADTPQPPNDEATQFAPVSKPPATKAEAENKAVSKVEVGTLINNNYEVKEVLKAGGMGEVYRGENVFTGDPVAIKVVLPELAEDEKVGLMFMREARTLSQLSDDAIVRYYNFVKDPAIDRYCLIMEFIRGLHLSDYTAKNGPLTKEAAATLLRRLAKGLQKAHAQGVIHRDLSPDNVMLPDGIIAEALLIDFGIAKSSVLQEGTMAGQFAGKFKYVSPEQLGHYGGEIGPATDIYGLALMMAAALLGKPLDMGSSVVEAVKAREAIPDLSAVPDTFRPILSYMLEPDPAERVDTMAEVVRLLDSPHEIPSKYRAGLPTPAAAIGGLSVPPTLAVGGLQHPPTTASGISLSPRPLEQPQPAAPAKPKESSGLGIIALLAIVFLAIIGGAVYYTLGRDPAPEQTVNNTPTDDPPAPARPPLQENSREGFLAGFDAGPCTYSARASSGPNAGMIVGFSDQEGAFSDLAAAYEQKFGTRPTIIERIITSEQCPALDLARAQQGRGIEPLTMNVDNTELESGSKLDGQITDPLGRNIWFVLISPRGGVYNLNDRLSGAVGNRSRFELGLSLAEGTTSAQQLLLAVATPESLANAAAAKNGANASVLLPLILDEITRSGGQVAVALSYVNVVLPTEEEPEGSNPEETPENSP